MIIIPTLSDGFVVIPTFGHNNSVPMLQTGGNELWLMIFLFAVYCIVAIILAIRVFLGVRKRWW